MTIQHWRIFVTVCDCGSITAAGNKLFLAQSAVSRAIMEIESFYNIQLFERANRRIQITSSGAAILGYAKTILNDYTVMENFIRGLETHLVLRIGASSSIAKFIFPEVLGAFEQQYPFIETKVTIDLTPVLETKVRNGEFDIVFTERTPSLANIKSTKMPGDRLCFFCAPNHPLAARNAIKFNELLDYKFCVHKKGQCSRDLFDAFCVLNDYHANCAFESIVGAVLTETVQRTDLIGLLPFPLLKPFFNTGALKMLNVTDVDLKRNYYAVSREGSDLSLMKQNKLIDIVRDIASRNYSQMEVFLKKGCGSV